MSTQTRQASAVDWRNQLPAYLDAVKRGNRLEAVDVALTLIERGVDPEDIVTDLLAAAQRAIGLGWQEGNWSVAMEHRASSIAESVLMAVVDTAMHAPNAIAEGSRGRAVVACSEGEWHVLPGRMASEILRLRGADVSFVGPSVPAEELAGMLGEDPPTAVAITCSMPLSLTGSWRTISALRALGMTVVCGGRGFGSDGRWGLAIGADVWAPDFKSGATTLMALLRGDRPAPREPIGAPETLEELRVLRREHEAIVQGATQIALDRWPYFRTNDAAVRATREDLSSTLSTIASATLVGDDAITCEFVEWFESVLSARGLPIAFVASAFDLLLEVLPVEVRAARARTEAGLAHCSGPGLPA